MTTAPKFRNRRLFHRVRKKQPFSNASMMEFEVVSGEGLLRLCRCLGVDWHTAYQRLQLTMPLPQAGAHQCANFPMRDRIGEVKTPESKGKVPHGSQIRLLGWRL